MVAIFAMSAVISNIYITKINTEYEKVWNLYENTNYFEGKIISNCTEKEYNYEYIIKTDKAKLLLYVRKNKANNKIYQYGDYVRIEGEFNKASEQRNYGGFDYRQYLKIKNISGILKASNIKVIRQNSSIINTIKNEITKNVKSLFPEEKASILLGLLLGEKELMSDQTIEEFRQSSLIHILCVSGMHISYISMGVMYFLDKTQMPRKKKSIITIMFLLIFLLLIGFTPSAVRAVFMSVLFLTSRILLKRLDLTNSISLSLIIILIINPYNIFDIGLILSYGGTIGILLFNKKVLKLLKKLIKTDNKILNYFRETLAVSISAQIIIWPITAYVFNTINFIFLISNILITPFLGISLILGIIVVIISFVFYPIAQVLSILLGFMLQTIIFIAKYSSQISILNIIITTPNILTIIFYYITVVLFRLNILKITMITTKVVIVLSVVFILIVGLNNLPHDLKIYFIDVGQGDSSLIITPLNKKILIDGGGSRDENYDIGKNIILPYLLDRKIDRLDYVIISHFDSDHCNGLKQVLQHLKIENLIISKQPKITEEYTNVMKIVKNKNIKVYICKSEEVINIENNMKFEVLSADSNVDNTNNSSIVGKFTYGKFNMLFTGDAELEIERKLINEYGGHLKSDILKVGHHGSKTSTSEEFLRKVNPKIAIIGVGENNTFGHPSQEILDRLKRSKSL